MFGKKKKKKDDTEGMKISGNVAKGLAFGMSKKQKGEKPEVVKKEFHKAKVDEKKMEKKTKKHQKQKEKGK